MPAYREHVLGFLRPVAGARRRKIVVDAANGMGCLYRPILEAAGVDLELLYFELDGTFPNHEPNPLKLENLAALCSRVRETGADLGVAFDGDADRAAFVDERGEPVGSDIATALIAGELLAREPGKAIVYDLRSSRAVAEHIRASGGVPVRERVGHSFIKATLRRHHGIFGGELAGHYYFRDNYYADCSLAAVFEILNLLRKSGRKMSELVAPLQHYHKTPEINFEVEDKAGAMAELARRNASGEIDYLDGITVQYPDWWFNVRPSNTEPLLRLVLEADTAEKLAEKKAILVGFLGEPV
jgi:phosphomannomutase